MLKAVTVLVTVWVSLLSFLADCYAYLKLHSSFNRHKLYQAYPKSQADVDFLDNLLKAGEDGVSIGS